MYKLLKQEIANLKLDACIHFVPLDSNIKQPWIGFKIL